MKTIKAQENSKLTSLSQFQEGHSWHLSPQPTAGKAQIRTEYTPNECIESKHICRSEILTGIQLGRLSLQYQASKSGGQLL